MISEEDDRMIGRKEWRAGEDEGFCVEKCSVVMEILI